MLNDLQGTLRNIISIKPICEEKTPFGKIVVFCATEKDYSVHHGLALITTNGILSCKLDSLFDYLNRERFFAEVKETLRSEESHYVFTYSTYGRSFGERDRMRCTEWLSKRTWL